jgi:hypothetical protein
MFVRIARKNCHSAFFIFQKLPKTPRLLSKPQVTHKEKVLDVIKKFAEELCCGR